MCKSCLFTDLLKSLNFLILQMDHLEWRVKLLISPASLQAMHVQQNKFYEIETLFSKAQSHKFGKNLWLSIKIQSGRIEKNTGFFTSK